MNNTYKENNENITQNLIKGTLFKFSSTAHYSRYKDTNQYATISSDPIPSTGADVFSITTLNNYSHIHKCSVIWNNKEHEALFFSYKSSQNRPYIKLLRGYINGNKDWGNSLPILQIITQIPN